MGSGPTDTPVDQPVLNHGEEQHPTDLHTTSGMDDDSASDISMSADSDDDESEIVSCSTIQVNPIVHVSDESRPLAVQDAALEPTKKRKLPEDTESASNDPLEIGGPQEVRKRLKPDDDHWTQDGHLPQDRSLLPAEIWHHIFTFSPSRALGNLLQVNKTFHDYLNPSSTDPSIVPLSRSVAQILKPDVIWQASRRLFRPGMPTPLSGHSELGMWRLACCSSCQFCGKVRPGSSVPPADPWHSGPGENGVVPIWSWGIRTCGSCLQQQSIKVGNDIYIPLKWMSTDP